MQYDIFTLPDLSLFHTAVPAGQRNFREHFHTECEISVLLSGKGTYLINGREYSICSGDVLIFGSNEAHCITQILPHEPFDMLTVKFEPKILWNSADSSTLVLLKLFFDRSDRFCNRVDRHNPATAEIRTRLIGMEREFRTRSVGFSLKLKLELLSILLTLVREYGYVKTDGDRSLRIPGPGRLAAAMDYVDRNLTQPLTLGEIAKSAAMSRAYLSTVFKKYNGVSLWDYITIKRVERAIELIRTTEMTRLQIAAECGFQSPANFYKAFRRITGRSPQSFADAEI